MDRTVPKSGSEEIQLYMRTYYSLLRSSHPIQIETLVESHMAIGSSLHDRAADIEPDISALVYASLRLPDCIVNVSHVLIGQIERSFIEAGYQDVRAWERVSAPGRRRRMHFNGSDSLAVFIASRSDIDDLVPTLTAYQVEWNKLHVLLKGEDCLTMLERRRFAGERLPDAEAQLLAETLQVPSDDLRRLEVVWGDHFVDTLLHIAAERKQINLRLLAGSLADYRRATAIWWSEVQSQLDEIDLESRPVYFVSSNTHSLINLLTGFAQREESNLVEYIEQMNKGDLVEHYKAVSESDDRKSLDNFLYYVLKKYLADKGQSARASMAADEQVIGIQRAHSRYGFDLEAQVIQINKLRVDWMDARLRDVALADVLERSDALILNIDYPLGLAAYELLNRVTERVGHLAGVYVMGKAATLNGRIGDVMIPNVVHDEHSQNTYLFQNCFSAQSVAPHLTYGMVLDNQKGITVPGTFLQNPRYMSVFYHEGYTDIEMEAGPFLSSVYEAFRPKLHPYNEIVNLYGIGFDVGFLHYASDTPMSKGKNLGAGSLSYSGVDPTYATAIAILRRIFSQEALRMRVRSSPSLERA
ncbi:MAG: hypothetical protein JNJ61_10040 [Anaerolineae bacterium]|nr:hypothetical protein [Anaerolineae bacterium]